MHRNLCDGTYSDALPCSAASCASRAFPFVLEGAVHTTRRADRLLPFSPRHRQKMGKRTRESSSSPKTSPTDYSWRRKSKRRMASKSSKVCFVAWPLSALHMLIEDINTNRNPHRLAGSWEWCGYGPKLPGSRRMCSDMVLLLNAIPSAPPPFLLSAQRLTPSS